MLHSDSPYTNHKAHNGASPSLALQFWWNTAMFCPGLKLLAALAELVVDVWILNALCLQETQKLSSCPHGIIFTIKSLIWNVASLTFVRNWARRCFSNRLWFAPCALKHNGTFARSVSSWWFFSPRESRLISRGTTIFVQFKFVSHLVDDSGVQLLCRGHCHLVDTNMYQH